jgi:hypothetical protein
MKKISLITYTNSAMEDAWPIYFGQLDLHLSEITSFVFSNTDSKHFKNHTCIKYTNSDPYYKQYLECLEGVSDDYVIYSQEDFFLYDDVTLESIQKYCDFLENSDYSFVRLIRAGYQTPLNNHVIDNLYKVDVNTSDAFSMQPTLWKKEKLIELYTAARSEKWYEAKHWNDACRKLGTVGVFTYNGEEKRGKFHYNSTVFPYTCTGINKGKWNMNEYGDFLNKMFKKYNVDPKTRGVRLSYNQWSG